LAFGAVAVETEFYLNTKWLGKVLRNCLPSVQILMPLREQAMHKLRKYIVQLENMISFQG